MEITIDELKDIINDGCDIDVYHDKSLFSYRFVVKNQINYQYSISFIFNPNCNTEIKVLKWWRGSDGARVLDVDEYDFDDLYKLSSLLCQKAIERAYEYKAIESVKVVKKVTKAFFKAAANN